MFCKTITLYYPHFCIIFSTQLIPGDITELDVCILNKLGIFFYVVICLHNIFADSSNMLIVHWGHRIAVLKLSFFDLVHPFLSQMPLAMRLKNSSHSSIFFCVEYGEVHSSSGFQYFIENIGMRSDHWRRQTC